MRFKSAAQEMLSGDSSPGEKFLGEEPYFHPISAFIIPQNKQLGSYLIPTLTIQQGL
jgi:hypothetical protein